MGRIRVAHAAATVGAKNRLVRGGQSAIDAPAGVDIGDGGSRRPWPNWSAETFLDQSA
ncbi:MAG: hypothetical protein M5U34_14450 [Chloroflexi bacterium]|nr:hypothetical protein [Chloroflexota bacterium]